LEPNKDAANHVWSAQLIECVSQSAIAQPQKGRQLFLIELVDTLLDVLRQHEVDEGLLLVCYFCG